MVRRAWPMLAATICDSAPGTKRAIARGQRAGTQPGDQRALAVAPGEAQGGCADAGLESGAQEAALERLQDQHANSLGARRGGG